MPSSSDPVAIVIDDARFRDLRAVADIQRQSFRKNLAYRYSVLLTLWALPFVSFRVARLSPNGKPVACMIADRDRTSVRIMNIAVHPEARRQHIGTRLMDDIAKRYPTGNVVLMVEEPNRAAQSLYDSLGFTRTGYRRNYYGTDRHGVEMTLYRGPQRVRRTVTVP